MVFLAQIEVLLTSYLAVQGRNQLVRRIDVYSRVLFPIGLVSVLFR